MTLRPVLAVLVALGLSAAALGAQTQFTLLVAMTDSASGKPVETLTPADVQVTEDGVAGTIVKIEPVVRSVKVQVLIDNGVGIGRNIVELKTGVRGLLERIPPDIETTVVTTSPQARFLVRPTKNRDELLKGAKLARTVHREPLGSRRARQQGEGHVHRHHRGRVDQRRCPDPR